MRRKTRAGDMPMPLHCRRARTSCATPRHETGCPRTTSIRPVRWHRSAHRASVRPAPASCGGEEAGHPMSAMPPSYDDTRWRSSANPCAPAPHRRALHAVGLFLGRPITTKLIALTSKRTKGRPASNLSIFSSFELEEHGEFAHLGLQLLDLQVPAIALTVFQSPLKPRSPPSSAID